MGVGVYFFMKQPHKEAEMQAVGVSFRYLYTTETSVAQLTQIEDANRTLEILKAVKNVRCIIVDSYELDAIWEKVIKQCGYFVCVIDDYHDRNHCCDLKISDNDELISGNNPNHNMVLLTGLEYVLISPKYRSIKAKKIDQITNVLITYGASDPTNESLKVLSCMEFLFRRGLISSDVRVDVVLGPLDDKIIVHQDYPLIKNLIVHRSPIGLADLISQSDLVFTAGGNTLLECVALCRPTIVTVTADNQNAITEKLERLNVIKVSGRSDVVSWTHLADDFLEMVECARSVIDVMKRLTLIDCKGAERVYQNISNLIQ